MSIELFQLKTVLIPLVDLEFTLVQECEINQIKRLLNTFQPIVAFHTGSSHLVCTATHLTDFLMKLVWSTLVCCELTNMKTTVYFSKLSFFQVQ